MPGGYTFDRLRDELALRIAAIPEFRAKLADSQLNLDYPVWVEDDEFDLDRHLLRIGLPSPGGRRELAEVCGHIATAPLERDKPLWEMWVIEGVSDTDPCAGGVLAVMTKVHHAAVDGVSGANLFSQLCTVEPDVPPPEPVAGAGSAGPLQIAAGGLVRFAVRVRGSWPVCCRRLSRRSRRRWGVRGAASHGRAVRGPADPVQRIGHRRPQCRAGPAGPRRHQEGQGPVQRHGQRRGDGVVRVGVAVVLERLRRAAGRSLVAMVPVSVHEQSDRPGHNQLSGMFCSLETHIGDPADRLRAIARADAAPRTTVR